VHSIQTTFRSVKIARVFFSAICVAAAATTVQAQESMRPDESVTIGKPALDTEFVDENGNAFRLSDLRGKPVVVSPIFTSCPHTCGMITSSLRDAVTAIGPPGGKYGVLTVSFDPADTPASLKAYREEQELPAEWKLAVGRGNAVNDFLASLDFHFAAEAGGGFSHANLVAILTPDQNISEYVYGVMFEEKEIRTALQTAVTGTSLVKKFRWWIVLAAVAGALATAVSVLMTRNRHSAQPV